MPSSIEIILVPTLMILLGFILKQINVLEADDSGVLSKIVLNISLPALIFTSLRKATLSSDMILLPVLALLLSFILAVIAYLFCKSRNYSKKVTWTIIIACSMMNTGFLGYPICLGVFGNDGFLHAIFYDLSTTLLFVIYGMVLVKEFGGNKDDIIKQGLLFMPLWAVVFSIVFNIFNIPIGYVLESSLNYLGQSTIPLIMLSLGLTIDFREIGHSLLDSTFVSLLKLIIAPIFMFIILSTLNISGIVYNVAILEAGMSSAMNGLVLAIYYNLDKKLMSSLIFTNTILSLITLTGIITFLV